MKGGIFLEKYFAYSVYDYLSIKKEEGEYETVLRQFGTLTHTLEVIAEEAFLLDNRKKTRELLTEILTNPEEQKLLKPILFLCRAFYLKR